MMPKLYGRASTKDKLCVTGRYMKQRVTKKTVENADGIIIAYYHVFARRAGTCQDSNQVLP
jgi:hypothetical protein